MNRRPAFVALLAVVVATPAAAQSLAVEKHAEPAPAALAAPLKPLLAAGGVRVTNGPMTIDFWWVEQLPLKSGGTTLAWTDVEEGTLVGAVRFSALYRDIRGFNIKPGVYTLRYGLQPANGDHLGVSPYRDFLLLSPAAADTDAKPAGHDAAVELSIQTIGGSHPSPLSLDPPVAKDAAPLSTRTNDSGHQAVIFEVPAARDGKPAGTIRFGLILVGKIEA
jgi:hypothetical protein